MSTFAVPYNGEDNNDYVDGEVVQHIEYVPFGEVFVEERNNIWNTSYLFNAKEFDEETGLYYYGARYYDPRLSLWIFSPMKHTVHNSPCWVQILNVLCLMPLALALLVRQRPKPNVYTETI